MFNKALYIYYSLLEKKSLGAEIFVERQFWSCVKVSEYNTLTIVILKPRSHSSQNVDDRAFTTLASAYD